MRARTWVIGAVLSTVALAGCAVINPPASHDGSSGHPDPSHTAHPATDTSPVQPLRAGESFVTVGVAEGLPAGQYTPQAPDGATDDYRCFLVDPGTKVDTFLTGVAFLPGNPDIVHHAILYRVDPAQVQAAQSKDAADPRPGWQCFGGPGLPSATRNPLDGLDAAPWLAGWAPGGREQVFGTGFGVPMSAGGRIVVQMHYNLRAVGDQQVSDDTHVRLRVSAGSTLEPLRTTLLPAPVELPCLPGESGSLCNRGDAVADVAARFGPQAVRTVGGLQLLCGGDPFSPKSGPTQSCRRIVRSPMTVRAAAGHMHLLGRSIRIEANAGTSRAKVLVDIPRWDFDNQGATPLAAPVPLRVGDTLTVTCTHDASLRNQLPSLRGTPPRYVVWGEGTTDEMCLGILIVSD